MKHPTEEELIAYREGEAAGREIVTAHVDECPECRTELDKIERVLAVFDAVVVPEPGGDYEQSVWRQLAPKLPEKRAWDWRAWMQPKRLAAVGALAGIIIAAFLAGRVSRSPRTGGMDVPAPGAAQVRQRVLVVAVSGHLDRTEMVLMELSNAAPAPAGKKLINISAEQQRAGDLLEENRLYRQTAQQEGDTALASVLADLERVLLDVAHSPQQVTPAQFESMRQRIEAKGILFKVRVVGNDLRQKQRAAPPAALQSPSGKGERNKV